MLVVVLERLEVRSSDPPRTIEGTIVDVHRCSTVSCLVRACVRSRVEIFKGSISLEDTSHETQSVQSDTNRMWNEHIVKIGDARGGHARGRLEWSLASRLPPQRGSYLAYASLRNC